MRRILVIGICGSGKSYLSNKLSEKLNIRLVHMDNLYWNKDKTHITREELIEKLKLVLIQDDYIIDGNYFHTLEYRLTYANEVIFLDFSFENAKEGILRRIGKKRDDLPWIETKEDGRELIDFISTYNNDTRTKIIKMLEEKPHIKVTILKSK